MTFVEFLKSLMIFEIFSTGEAVSINIATKMGKNSNKPSL